MAERVFAMPDLGEGLEEGEITSWLVDEGDRIELNQPLVEVETAKAAVEIPSPFSGVVARLHGAEGSTVPVGAPLVTFEVEESASRTAAEETRPAPEAADVAVYPPTIERSFAGPVAATPPVRRLAKELGVDLAAVAGTGPGGRVAAEDVRRVAEGSEGAVDDGPVATVREDLRTTETPVTPTRRAIAGNLERQAAIPQVTTFRALDCSALETFRREREVSPLPIVIAALARVADAFPLMNASWGADVIRVHGKINVGIAVDTERGLLVPVLRDAGRRGIADVATEIRWLAEGARAGSLAPGDMSGATIAVSNTGSYSSEAGTPILSPGTSVTLAVGVIALRALVVGGEVVARPACTLSLTFDHRVLDGAAVGRALTDFVELLQSPERLRDLPR